MLFGIWFLVASKWPSRWTTPARGVLWDGLLGVTNAVWEPKTAKQKAIKTQATRTRDIAMQLPKRWQRCDALEQSLSYVALSQDSCREPVLHEVHKFHISFEGAWCTHRISLSAWVRLAWNTEFRDFDVAHDLQVKTNSVRDSQQSGAPLPWTRHHSNHSEETVVVFRLLCAAVVYKLWKSPSGRGRSIKEDIYIYVYTHICTYIYICVYIYIYMGLKPLLVGTFGSKMSNNISILQ